MKKGLLMLLLPFLASATLASCVKYNGKCKTGDCEDTGSAPTTSSTGGELPPGSTTVTTTPVEPGTQVTYYLNLGRYGKLNGTAGTAQAEVFLEYALKLTGKSGDALPGVDAVTSSQFGVVFEKWVLSGTQQIYNVIPDINNAILVAVYSGSGEGSGGGGDSGGGSAITNRTTDFPSTGYGFKFTTGEGYVASYFGPDPYRENSEQFLIKNAHFAKGETFSLINFETNATWADPLDPYSLGGSTPESKNWETYLQKNGTASYTVLQDFDSSEIYLKMKYEDNIIYFSL